MFVGGPAERPPTTRLCEARAPTGFIVHLAHCYNKGPRVLSVPGSLGFSPALALGAGLSEGPSPGDLGAANPLLQALLVSSRSSAPRRWAPGSASSPGRGLPQPRACPAGPCAPGGGSPAALQVLGAARVAAGAAGRPPPRCTRARSAPLRRRQPGPAAAWSAARSGGTCCTSPRPGEDGAPAPPCCPQCPQRPQPPATVPLTPRCPQSHLPHS